MATSARGWAMITFRRPVSTIPALSHAERVRLAVRSVVPAEKGHNAQSIAGMVPEGASSFEGKRDEEIVVTFDREGIYGFECKPHAGMGMVGVIVVGNAGDTVGALDTAKLRGKKMMERLLAQLSN